MLRFEIKKVFSKTINKIVLIALIAVTLLAGLLAIKDVKYITENGETVSGFKAGQKLQELKNQYKGELNEDVLQEVIWQNEMINKSSENEDIAYQKKQGFSDIKEMITLAFGNYNEYDYYTADKVSTENVKTFYQRRIAGLKEYLNSEEIKNTFSESEKNYLISQYEKTETPFHYEYADGWKALLDSEYLPTLMTVIIVLIGFMVAGIFSDEYQYKADSIFFSAKLGRNKAVISKVGAGFIITTVMYWGSIILYSSMILMILGFGGANCPIQTGLSNWNSVYNFTYLQDYFITMFGGYIGTLFILALAMFISAKYRSTVIATTIPFILSCIPMFLGRVSIFSRITAFTPDQLLRIGKCLEEFVLVTIGGKTFGYILIIIPIYLILYFVLIPFLYSTFKKAEVK